jgi:hypothetical protein
MEHRIIIQGKIYNPPLAVLNRYLFTRKKERTIAGITMPGLFSVYNFNETLIGFLLIFVLEFSATILAMNVGLAPLMVIVLIIVDFVLAFLAHIPRKKVLVAKNQRIIENNQFSLLKINKRIRQGRRFTYFFDFLLIVSASFKIFFVYELLGASIFSPLGIFIIVAYIIAAWLHIFCTGDFVHTVWINRQNSAAIDQFKESGGAKNSATRIRIVLKESNYILGPDDITVPSIVKEGNTYFIDSPGVPDDEDLNRIIMRQLQVDLQRNVIEKGIEMQLMSIGALRQNEVSEPAFKG